MKKILAVLVVLGVLGSSVSFAESEWACERAPWKCDW